MIVRLLKPWKGQKVGRILNSVPDGAANLLIKRMIAEEVKPEKAEPQKKVERFKRVGA